MYGKILLNSLLIIILVVLQVAFISGLPGWINGLNLVIVFLIFVLEIADVKIALILSMGIGLIIDIYSFSSFGIYLISFPLMVMLTNYLLINYFTDRSLYSFLVLTFFAYLSFEVVLYILEWGVNFLYRSDYNLNLSFKFWFNKTRGLFVSLVMVFIGFNLLNLVSHKLKPAFLIRKK